MRNCMRGTAALVACLWTGTAIAEPNASTERTTSSVSAATGAQPRAAVNKTRMLQYAAHGGQLESLLLREDDALSGERLTGVTRLADGTRLWEEARFDRTGTLIRAEMMCAGPAGASETLVFDAKLGTVEIRTATIYRRWSVPTDHPWIWVPHSCSQASQTPLATPVSAMVAVRGGAGEARRLIDTSKLKSHSIMLDQVMVQEDDGAVWVILGDDALLVRDGQPQHWRANSLGLVVEPR